MPRIVPVRGLRYRAKAGPLATLLAPPYDVIGGGQRRALEARNPYNSVRLELAAGGDEGYARVAALAREWEAGGILAWDGEPMLYAYEQRFTEGGQQRVRRALLAGVEVQPWDEGAVRPHEFTMSAPKEDRLRLLQAAGVQFSPVFLLAKDRAGGLQEFFRMGMSGSPAAEGVTPEGEEHRLWAVEAGRGELRSLAPLLSETFVVADGHHRYETALQYRDSLGGGLAPDHPARFALAGVVAADDPGLVIRPIHRLVGRRAPADWRERIERTFDIEHVHAVGSPDSQVRALGMELANHAGAMIALGLEPGQVFTLRPREGGAVALPPGRSGRWGSVPAIRLRYGVLEPLWGFDDESLAAGEVEYTHDAREVVDRVARSAEACGFLVGGTQVGDVMALAEAGERLPQKTTYFYPKLATGLVFYPVGGR